jgi:hypothetical protein
MEFTEIFLQIAEVITGNPNIWIPVLSGWMLGFLYSLRLTNKGVVRRKADKELRVYAMNGGIAFILYVAFNFPQGIAIFLPQATLASTVAVLLPAAWFRWKAKRDA